MDFLFTIFLHTSGNKRLMKKNGAKELNPWPLSTDMGFALVTTNK
jgi:hypothetical protein